MTVRERLDSMRPCDCGSHKLKVDSTEEGEHPRYMWIVCDVCGNKGEPVRWCIINTAGFGQLQAQLYPYERTIHAACISWDAIGAPICDKEEGK